MDAELVLRFDSADATLERAGGKGANLARLTRTGLPVPPGFIVTTAAYKAFVAASDLWAIIAATLSNLRPEDPADLERASIAIRAAFRVTPVPGTIVDNVRSAYTELGEGPVAVRSSATAEDLPDLSFAGQQDTFLNVIGFEALMAAVVECWSSLWTARAIGYRQRNAIGQEGVALAVAVQTMAPAEASGVLFTANPLTGHRGQTVIDATLGLGEALVSGQVEPDHLVFETTSGKLLERTLGRKQVVTRELAGGGVSTTAVNAADRSALSDADTARLVELGRRVQAEYGAPQDIEWALADGSLALLQSRAITSLFPMPDVRGAEQQVWISFGAIQGLLGPMTPLGRDFIAMAFAGGSRAFGAQGDFRTQTILATAGERLWLRYDGILRNPLGRSAADTALPMVEPSIARIFEDLGQEPGLRVTRSRLRLSTLWRLAGFVVPVLLRFPQSVLFPDRARTTLYAFVDQTLERLARLVHPDDMNGKPVAERLNRLLTDLTVFPESVVPPLLRRFVPLLGPSIAMLRVLTSIAEQADAAEHGVSGLVLEVTRGLPHNVTTEMDLALWATAQAIRADSAALERFSGDNPQRLAADYLAGRLPAAAQAALATFLGRYGMRGLGEIDLGRPRWRENPTEIMQTVQSYLQITDPDRAPDAVFKRGAESANRAVDQLAAAAGRRPGGWIKSRLVRFAARRIRALMGAREMPKFFIIRLMGMVRAALLDCGAEMQAAGRLERADDVFYLHADELLTLADRPTEALNCLVAERRAADARETRRRQVPRVLASDGRAFYEGLSAPTSSGDALGGSPVSPGVVEGAVRVVLDPHATQLLPGEILVCPGTDPAWTPLFLAAGGLITEVGGMMTHGSVVAREYGIPAVVGVHQATMRLHTGQRIRVDGSSGVITVLDG